MAKIRPATLGQLTDVRITVELLKQSRANLKYANCPKTLERVRLALSSAKGALRHIEHRHRRTSP